MNDRTKPHVNRVDEMRPSVHGVAEDTPWTPSTNLAAPPARPGYGQRWIRVSLRGDDDPVNIGRALQEGWSIVRADQVADGFHPPKITQGQYAGCVGVQGMILCEMPLARLKQREAYYANIARNQIQAVDEDINRLQTPGMPLTVSRSSQVEHGVRRPLVADDE